MDDDAAYLTPRAANDHRIHSVLPGDGMGGGYDPPRRDEHSMAFAGQVRQCRKFGGRHAITQIRDIVADDDRVGTERCQEKQ
ncbi:hypothetical protein GLA29479_4802 [Lysobacter antibioticus]|nr:hypothetical protein GLA29479_4802 [Lysobacter antibioticus]